MAQETLQYIFDLLKGKNTLGPEFKKIQKEAENLQDTLKEIGKTSAVVFAGFSASIGGAVKVAAGFEKIATSFNVLTGSIEKTNEVMEILKNSAAGDAFSFEQISDAAKRFLTFGFSIKELDTLLKQTGDVAAISGASIEDLARIFGKVSTESKFTTRELTQLQNAGIPIGPALAKSMGIGEESVKSLAEQGRINFTQFREAFASLSKEGGFAFNGLAQISSTLSGKLDNLGDEFEFLSEGIGKFFLPAFKDAITYVTDLIKEIRKNEALTEFISKALAVGAALSGIIAVIAGVSSAIIGLVVSFKALAIAAQFAGVTLKSALISSGVGIAILALSIGIADLAANWETRTKQMASLWSEFSKAVSAIADNIGTYFGAMLDIMKARFDLAFTIIGAVIDGFVNTKIASIKNLGDIIQKFINFDFKGAKSEFSDFSKIIDEGASATAESINKASEEFDNLKASIESGEKYIPITFQPDLTEVKKAEEEITKPLVKNFSFAGGDTSQISTSISNIVEAFKNNGIVDSIKQFGKESVVVAKSIANSVATAWKNADFSKLKESLVPAFGNAVKSGEEGAKKFLSGAVSAVASSMFGPLGQVAGSIMDLMMMGSDELNKTLDSFLQAIPKIVEQIINNIPVVILALIRNLPILIEAFTRIAIKYGTDPLFWNQIMMAVVTAFIGSVPLMIEGFVKGFKDGLTGGIIDSIKGAFEKLSGFWKNIFKFDGGGKGTVESFLGFDFPFIKFAKGGRVGGRAKTMGDSELNDIVPALLSPDEIVIPRSVALGDEQGILNFLKNLNAISPDFGGVTALASQGIEPRKMGFGGSIGGFFSGLVSSATSFVEQVTGIVDSFGNKVGGVFSQDDINSAIFKGASEVGKYADEYGVGEYLSRFGLDINKYKDLIDSLMRLGLKPDPVAMARHPFDYIYNLIKSNVDIFKSQFKNLIKLPIGMSEGGMPLGTGMTDSIPAMLTPRELVVDRTTTRQLQNFLNGDRKVQQDSGLLNEILNTVRQPLVVQTTATLNGQAFADIILELNRKNARMAI